MIFHHHRQMGTAKYGGLMAKLKDGEKDYALGAHPVWEIFRCFYQMTKPPYIVAGCALFVGYAGAVLRRSRRSVTPEIMAFRRAEQLIRLRKFITGNRIFANDAHRRYSRSNPEDPTTLPYREK
jgi:hypothetical protein